MGLTFCVSVALWLLTALAQAPSDLLEMMTSFSGPPSDRPFVPPVTYLGYGVQPSHDPVADLIKDVQAGKVRLKFEGEDGYLISLLEALPADAKKAIYARMPEVMASRFSAVDREAVTKILKESKNDF